MATKKDKIIDGLSYSYGLEIGDDIAEHLPTLSCDSLKSRNVIQVTYGEAQELYRLDAVWYDNHSKINEGENDPNWILLQAEHRKLEAKYIPQTHTWFRMGGLPEGLNIDQFKQGIVNSMWNCDYSHYSCDVNDVEVNVKENICNPKEYPSRLKELLSKNPEPYTYYTTEIILKYKK